ncbi:uncharacterized protein LOC113502056 [Trichoplusia ni]|uniref:Uncharacterized protein LOC113502056 n=1 Tax=Trichoplusia ni TaxID=7111 RepID=A0A7E5WGH8_TRINI|nr:uncharacterized protein LOC113502056 [Trichoplusia ni]
MVSFGSALTALGHEAEEESLEEDNFIENDDDETKLPPYADCWMSLNAGDLFQVVEEIDERYSKSRIKIQEMVHTKNFDDTMLQYEFGEVPFVRVLIVVFNQAFLGTGGAAIRELYHTHFHFPTIPSGINLGGFCMQRMPESVLFFHRMKLRNNTYFRVDSLTNDLGRLVMYSNLSLNDLHLKGAYERALTDRDPSTLIYAPTYGEVEILLKNVKYDLEGRYRLVKGRLMLELISSELRMDDVLMTYMNQAIKNQAVRISKGNIGVWNVNYLTDFKKLLKYYFLIPETFISRLKLDLDKWIKDYFNDFLIYAELEGLTCVCLRKYDKEKAAALEKYTDEALMKIRERIRELHADAIRVPEFTIFSKYFQQIKLYDGVLRGLDSIYRRSVATGIKKGAIRKVDTIVGFSKLKVVYKYEAVIPTGVPPLTGVMTLSANELTAHLSLSLVNNPESIDLDINFLEQMKPESLTVEGAANIMISNFKHLLEHQIVAIMGNTLIHGVSMLRSLPRCGKDILHATSYTYIL